MTSARSENAYPAAAASTAAAASKSELVLPARRLRGRHSRVHPAEPLLPQLGVEVDEVVPTAGLELPPRQAESRGLRGFQETLLATDLKDLYPVELDPARIKGVGTATKGLFTLTDDSLMMWDIAARKTTRTLALPSLGSALAVDSIAAIPTSDGVLGVAYAATSTNPIALATRAGNSYYRKALASSDRLYLFDGRSVDVFETRFGFAPHFINSARPAGVVDFAISPGALFTVASNGTVSAWSRDGYLVAQSVLSEGNDVQMLVEFPAAVKGQVADGKLRLLATSGPKRFPSMADVPTVEQAGIKGYEVTSWNGVFAPKSTRPQVIATLNKALAEVLAMPDIQARFLDLGVVARPSSPEELMALLKADIAKWADVIAKAGIEKK